MQFVTFKAISGEGDTGEISHERDLEFGEDDVPVGGSEPTPATIPVTIVNPGDRIRSFGPRKYGKPGTRIVFLSGAGLPVLETPDEVQAALTRLYS